MRLLCYDYLMSNDNTDEIITDLDEALQHLADNCNIAIEFTTQPQIAVEITEWLEAYPDIQVDPTDFIELVSDEWFRLNNLPDF